MLAFGPRIAMVDIATLNRRATETSALPHKSADLRGASMGSVLGGPPVETAFLAVSHFAFLAVSQQGWEESAEK